MIIYFNATLARFKLNCIKHTVTDTYHFNATLARFKQDLNIAYDLWSEISMLP